MSEMSWVEYAERIAVPGTISILPVGSTEQHGPHMSMNTDILLPTEIAMEVARRINAIVSPTLAYGYKSIQRSGGGNHFSGTTSLDGNTLSCMVRDISRELARHGARHVVLLNGHFENVYFLLEGADLAIRDVKAANIKTFEVLTLTYWDFIESETIAKVFTDGFRRLGAGARGNYGNVADVAFVSAIREHVLSPDRHPPDFPAVRHVAPGPGTHPARWVSGVSREGDCGQGPAIVRNCGERHR